METNEQKLKELFHYWYHLGVMDGFSSSLNDKQPDFRTRLEEFKKEYDLKTLI